MENVPTVQKHVDGLAAQVASLEVALKTSVNETLPETLTPMEQAEHYALLSYALNSIIFAYLKSTGTETKSHPIMLELERIKASLAKIKRVQEGKEDKAEKRIDSDVAKRIITHSLGRRTVFKDEEDSSAKADAYLKRMAQESEDKIKAKENPVTLSDEDGDTAPTETSSKPPKESDKKRKKSKKASSSKKQKN